MKKIIRQLLEEPSTSGLDLNSAEATKAQRELIEKKAFLKKLYQQYYDEFKKADKLSPQNGIRVELGSGGGFLHKQISGLKRIDLRPAAHVDIIASALELPFKDESVGAIFMLNVLHHLQNPKIFFKEASRVLVKNGRIVMIEPYVSPLSKLIYTYLHHEPFDPAQKEWILQGKGAMTSANDAMPWIIFERDRELFESQFKQLNILRVEPHTIMLYLLSGGLSYRAIMPGFAFKPLAYAEKSLGPLKKRLASMMTVEIIKQ
jgi:SAM-dependent methyltransferase